MIETICDIHRLNYAAPFFYTEKYLSNAYVRANDLSKHIHLFNQQISRIDYALFADLKGAIHQLAETEKEKISDGATRSNPYEIKNTIFTFCKNFELNQVLTLKDGFQEELLFSESLKSPRTLQIVKSVDNINSSQTDITYTDFLECEVIEEKNFYNDQKSKWVKPNQRNTRYVTKENGLIYKIHLRNNLDEQSKTTVVYNHNFQILESKTYSQKNKTELLYEAIFEYDKATLKKITYIRHQPTKAYEGNWMQELLFEYNEKGLLINFTNNFTRTTWAYDQNENPVSIKEFDNNGHCSVEIYANYEYDKHSNWTYKETRKLINKIEKSHKQATREIEYF